VSCPGGNTKITKPNMKAREGGVKSVEEDDGRGEKEEEEEDGWMV